MGSSIVATRFYRTVYRENSAVFNTGVFQNPIFLQMPTEEPHFFRNQTVTVGLIHNRWNIVRLTHIPKQK